MPALRHVMLMTAHDTTHSGARVDIARPRRESFRIADIAEHLSRLTPSPATRGFYSYAQRGALLAEAAIAETNEPEAGLYGLLNYAPLAYTGAPSAKVLSVMGADSGNRLAVVWNNLALAIHRAHDLDWPHPRAQLLLTLHTRLELTELKTLRHGVADEIADMETRGIKPLPRPIHPTGFNKACEQFLTLWQRYAAAAGIPRGGR